MRTAIAFTIAALSFAATVTWAAEVPTMPDTQGTVCACSGGGNFA